VGFTLISSRAFGSDTTSRGRSCREAMAQRFPCRSGQCDEAGEGHLSRRGLSRSPRLDNGQRRGRFLCHGERYYLTPQQRTLLDQEPTLPSAEDNGQSRPRRSIIDSFLISFGNGLESFKAELQSGRRGSSIRGVNRAAFPFGLDPAPDMPGLGSHGLAGLVTRGPNSRARR